MATLVAPDTGPAAPTYDTATIVAGLYGDALRRPCGALGRGPNRHYVEVHPERLRGFVVPNPGAMNQPWHRDFPAPAETLVGRRLNSLAFNLTCVDTTAAMGPFEVAPGTQWDDPSAFAHGMVPPRALYPRYEARARRKLPQVGDVSARPALTTHRGTANHSQKSRPVLVLGVDASRPVVQAHTIERLIMGEARAQAPRAPGARRRAFVVGRPAMRHVRRSLACAI